MLDVGERATSPSAACANFVGIKLNEVEPSMAES